MTELRWLQSLNFGDLKDLSQDLQRANRQSAPNPLCEFSLTPSWEKEGKSRRFYRRCCEWFSMQTQPCAWNHSSSPRCPCQLLGADPGRLFCFDWRIHSRCQDFRISFLILSGSWYFTATRAQNAWAGIVSPQTKLCCWLMGTKAKRVAHLSEKWTTVYTVSGQCVQDNSAYFLCMDSMHQICSNFCPVASWESAAGLYLTPKSLCCNFTENTIRECLIYVMMRAHKVVCVVGLSFNLSKGGKNTAI